MLVRDVFVIDDYDLYELLQKIDDKNRLLLILQKMLLSPDERECQLSGSECRPSEEDEELPPTSEEFAHTLAWKLFKQKLEEAKRLGIVERCEWFATPRIAELGRSSIGCQLKFRIAFNPHLFAPEETAGLTLPLLLRRDGTAVIGLYRAKMLLSSLCLAYTRGADAAFSTVFDDEALQYHFLFSDARYVVLKMGSGGDWLAVFSSSDDHSAFMYYRIVDYGWRPSPVPLDIKPLLVLSFNDRNFDFDALRSTAIAVARAIARMREESFRELVQALKRRKALEERFERMRDAYWKLFESVMSMAVTPYNDGRGHIIARLKDRRIVVFGGNAPEPYAKKVLIVDWEERRSKRFRDRTYIFCKKWVYLDDALIEKIKERIKEEVGLAEVEVALERAQRELSMILGVDLSRVELWVDHISPALLR